MREHLAQLKTRRKYYEDISSERAAREAEAEETEAKGQFFFLFKSPDYQARYLSGRKKSNTLWRNVIYMRHSLRLFSLMIVNFWNGGEYWINKERCFSSSHERGT